MTVLLLVAGLVVLSVGAEVLIAGAVRIARRLGLSPLVVGLTVVAFGTSAPELAVSVQAAVEGRGAIAIGNALGSNVFNVFVILGIAGLVRPLGVSQRLVRREVPMVILASLAIWALAWAGCLDRPAGAVLLLILVGITAWQVRTSRAEACAAPDPANAGLPGRLLPAVLLVVGGLVGLVYGARIFVEGAVELARTLGVSEAVIAVTLVAGGTSLPELATSLLATIRGQRDIAVGNVIGSNLFNLLAVLGGTMLVGGRMAPPEQAFRLDLPFATLAAALCLPFLWGGRRFGRMEAGLFLGLFALYLALLLAPGA